MPRTELDWVSHSAHLMFDRMPHRHNKAEPVGFSMIFRKPILLCSISIFNSWNRFFNDRYKLGFKEKWVDLRNLCYFKFTVFQNFLHKMHFQSLWISIWLCIWTPNNLKFWNIVVLLVYFDSGNIERSIVGEFSFLTTCFLKLS